MAMDGSPLEPELMTKIMRSVRVQVRVPMRIRVARLVKGKLRDAHVFEVEADADITALQREVTGIVKCWKGGFDVGTTYTLERVE